jgi:hypothetical protein
VPDLSVRARLVDLLVGSAAETCAVPSEPVPFGRKHWLAQHRWLEPVVGLVALLPVGALYALGFGVLTRAAAVALMVVWAAFLAGGLVLRVRRPCTVLRLPVHALLLLVVVLATAGATGLAAT